MDPVTASIVAAIAAGVSKIGEQAVSDSYAALKKLLANKFGEQSEVVNAVERLESKPESEGRKATLEEEITGAKADEDDDILKAAQAILKLLESQPEGGQFIQKATGKFIAQAGQGGTASVQVNQPDKD
jgi:hypothetical protein